MKPSQIELDIIEPEILNESNGIEAWFSCKNIQPGLEEHFIKGLNLGFNTNEKAEIVEQNRSLLLSSLGIDAEWIAYAGQVHGNRVQVVAQGGTYGETDALVTQVPGLTLAIQVADCAAVLLADAQKKIVAAVHAGWRGAAGDILPGTITKMHSLGAAVKDIKAFVSPCISQQNFEVGNEVADQFPDNFVDYQSYKKPHIDLKSFLEHQLRKMGISKENIQIHEGCTVAEEQRYYSYRREQQNSGRMLAAIRYKVIGG